MSAPAQPAIPTSAHPAPPAPEAPAPAPAPATPTTPSGPLGITEDALAEFDFDAPSPSPSPSPAGATPERAEGVPLAPTAPAAPAAPGTPAQPLDDEAVANLAKLLHDGGIPKEVESAFLATNRGRRMLDTFKAMRELESPPDPNNPSIGGIGFVPTTEQIRQFYSASSAFESLQDEFDNNPESFFVNFFRPVQTDSGPQFRPGVPQIASFFLRGLEQFDPSGSLASTAVQPILDRPYVYFPVISQMVGELRSLGTQLPTGTNKDEFGVDEKSRVLDAAQILQSRLDARSGRAAPPPASTAAPPPGQPDPLAAERARLNQQSQLLAQQQQAISNNIVSSIRASVANDLESMVRTDIDKLLTTYGVKSGLESTSPTQYSLYLDTCLQDVYKTITGSAAEGRQPLNPALLQSFNITLNNAIRAAVQSRQSTFPPGSRGDVARSHAVRQYQQLARAAVRQLSKQFVTNGGVKVMTQTTPPPSTLARMDAAAHQVEVPSGTGPAVQHSLVSPVEIPKPQPGQDYTTSIADFLANRMKSAAGIR